MLVHVKETCTEMKSLAVRTAMLHHVHTINKTIHTYKVSEISVPAFLEALTHVKQICSQAVLNLIQHARVTSLTRNNAD